MSGQDEPIRALGCILQGWRSAGIVSARVAKSETIGQEEQTARAQAGHGRAGMEGALPTSLAGLSRPHPVLRLKHAA